MVLGGKKGVEKGFIDLPARHSPASINLYLEDIYTYVLVEMPATGQTTEGNVGRVVRTGRPSILAFARGPDPGMKSDAAGNIMPMGPTIVKGLPATESFIGLNAWSPFGVAKKRPEAAMKSERFFSFREVSISNTA